MDKEDFLLQFVEKIDYFLSWKFLSLCLIATSIILAVIHIPSIDVILEPMYTTIRMYLAWIWLLSFIGLIYKALYTGFMYFQNKIEQKIFTRQAELERKKQELEYENSMKSLLNSLSPKEIAILKFVLNEDGCRAWLPVENITVLSLAYKKCLLPMLNVSTVCREILDNKSCFAYGISSDLLSYINMHKDVVSSKWVDIPSADYMKIYQKQL